MTSQWWMYVMKPAKITENLFRKGGFENWVLERKF